MICISPSGEAEDLAGHVAAQGFQGFYIDANAISPHQAQNIALTMQEAGISFVDGSTIGGPAWKPNTTRLYLSGAHARKAAPNFSAGPLGVNTIGESIGQVSALKMCYEAYTTGSTALLCAILAEAEALEVWENLMEEWSLSGSNLTQESTRRVRRVTAKAWRFSDKMEEIAATFDSVGIPDGFHAAYADIYT